MNQFCRKIKFTAGQICVISALLSCIATQEVKPLDVVEKSRLEAPAWLKEASRIDGSGVFNLEPNIGVGRFVVIRRGVRDIKLVINQEKTHLSARLSQEIDRHLGVVSQSPMEPEILDIYFEKRRDFTNPLATAGFDLYVLVGLREDPPSAH